MVTICDPVGQKLVRLDTLTKTATIMPRIPGSPRSGTQPQIGTSIQRAYCKTHAPMASAGALQSDDLGHQTIEGWDAQGVRTTRPLHVLLNSEGTPETTTTETWCLEELGVMLLRVTQVTGRFASKTEMKLTKIVPGEPDPSLFQIPPDYRIVERVLNETSNGQLRPFGATQAAQPSAPAVAPPN